MQNKMDIFALFKKKNKNNNKKNHPAVWISWNDFKTLKRK